eukprot:TRINITY_DN7006_c0_g1_i1.p1 TRINITY_DN7006_c0_g1~~TRINITY_DN7006_c0_g1_i1.p1  ORF type:complete len:249 (+),score=25.15 TRINITY_DN7006_c0_g1_i1:104-850(+)
MKTSISLSLLTLGLALYMGCTRTQGAPTVMKYTENNTTIVRLSMSAKFVVKVGETSHTLKLDDKNITISGNISSHSHANQSYHIINFIITWNDTHQFILTFNSTSQKWAWTNSTFVFIEPYVILPLEKMISSFGDGQITTQQNQSYTCQSALDYSNSIDKSRVSVTWSQFQVEVYPTNNTKFDPSSKRCTVDLDDKIVPIAVGGALGLLLLLVVIIYVISYIRDRRQQSKELRSGYNRIDQPEPNHHS